MPKHEPIIMDDEDCTAFLYWPPADLDEVSATAVMASLAEQQWGIPIRITTRPKRWWYRDPEGDEDEEAVFPVEADDPRAKLAWTAEFEQRITCINCGRETAWSSLCSEACRLQVEHGKQVAGEAQEGARDA